MQRAASHVPEQHVAPARCKRPFTARRPSVVAARCQSVWEPAAAMSRRGTLGAATLAVLSGALQLQLPAHADDFTKTPSGLKFFDIKVGEGSSPEPGDTVVVDWAGYTKGYQGKRIGNSSTEGEPYEFVLGAQQAIPAFEEAVASMRAGGVRRVEVPGNRPELGYPLDRSKRFTNEYITSGPDRIYKYRYGPQPIGLFGQRAIDFVLDNPTLQDFNRDLLFDIRLLNVRKARK